MGVLYWPVHACMPHRVCVSYAQEPPDCTTAGHVWRTLAPL